MAVRVELTFSSLHIGNVISGMFSVSCPHCSGFCSFRSEEKLEVMMVIIAVLSIITTILLVESFALRRNGLALCLDQSFTNLARLVRDSSWAQMTDAAHAGYTWSRSSCKPVESSREHSFIVMSYGKLTLRETFFRLRTKLTSYRHEVIHKTMGIGGQLYTHVLVDYSAGYKRWVTKPIRKSINKTITMALMFPFERTKTTLLKVRSLNWKSRIKICLLSP